VPPGASAIARKQNVSGRYVPRARIFGSTAGASCLAAAACDDLTLRHCRQAKGSEPLKQHKWKAIGVKSVFEKAVKGNVFEVDNERCQLQLPADDKVNMHVTMGVLVIQVRRPLTH
jgi:hypothetical protein